MTAEALESGYREAYQDFYRWLAILRGAWAKEGAARKLRHMAYVGGWKKCEPMWNWVIRARRMSDMRPMLERVLGGLGGQASHVEQPEAGARQMTSQQRGFDMPNRASY